MERKIWERLTQGKGFFKLVLCHHCYLLCVCYHLTHILRDAAPGYHFVSNRQTINHLLYMDDLKLYASNEKSLESLIQTVHVFSNDIGIKFEVEKCVVLTIRKTKMTKHKSLFQQLLLSMSCTDIPKSLDLFKQGEV